MHRDHKLYIGTIWDHLLEMKKEKTEIAKKKNLKKSTKKRIFFKKF